MNCLDFRRRLMQTAWVTALLTWLGTLGWTVYKVVLTCTLQADTSWALPDGAGR